jgi:hypothetical protein
MPVPRAEAPIIAGVIAFGGRSAAVPMALGPGNVVVALTLFSGSSSS